MQIPLSNPDIGPAERENVQRVLETGNLKGGGPFDDACRELMEGAFDVEFALMTTSCTHALEMAALLLRVDESDEVIVPSFTFPSTANAFALRGADITFCEVDPDTLNMDPEALQTVISEETSVVVPVHYAGVGCEMHDIMEIADRYDAAVVEDAAQGVNAMYDDEYLGTVGHIGAYSFHATKNYVGGEGGALLLNDVKFVERAEIIRQKGTNYEQFVRGEVDEYTWVDLGSSYVPSELQSALVSAQLERRDQLRDAREEVHQRYMDGLEELEQSGNVRLPTIPADRESNYHIFYLVTESRAIRDELETYLRDAGFGAASHYRPLHTSRMGQSLGYEPGDLEITEQIAESLIRLPINASMSIEDCDSVIDAVVSFYDSI